MLTGPIVTTLLCVVANPLQSAQDVLRTVRERQQARWETVRNYTIVQKTVGREVPIYHEKIVVDGESTFRIVPQEEWERTRTGQTREETVAFAENMAIGLDLIGDGHQREVGGPMGSHIKSMTSEMSYFLREIKHTDTTSGGEARAAGVGLSAEFARRARLAGRATVGARPAFLLRAEGLSDVKLEQEPGGPQFTLDRVALWVDAEHYVPLRLTMEGRMAGVSTPVVIELLEQEYQTFDALYEPTQRTMRISGLMEAMATDPAKKRDLQRARQAAEKAQADMAVLEARMAELPPAQRGMVEGQMKRGLDQLRKMTEEGVIEAEVELKVIGVNQGPPLDWRPGS